jgi:manganese/zinc/iron transport system permease protein
MIAALLILPGVTARFWTDRLGRMLLLAACIGAATGFLGAALSARYSLLPAGPIIVLVGSGFFIVSAAAAPRRGVLGRLVAEWRFRREVAMRNLMRLLYERVEANPARGSTVAELESARAWSSGQLASLLLAAARQGWTHLDPAGAIGLTEAGLRRGAEIARGYRLWQLFLTEYPDQATGLVNLADESAATALPQELVAALTAKLQRAGRWPPLPAAPEETP